MTATAAPERAPTRRRTPSRRAVLWLQRTGWRHLVMLAFLVFALFPILFVVSAALNPLGTLSSSTLVPRAAGLQNFTELLGETRFGRWYGNSLLLALTNAAATVLLSAMAAYVFSRFRFRGRRLGLYGLLVIQMFPQFLAIVAIYLMFSTVSDYWPTFGFNTRGG